MENKSETREGCMMKLTDRRGYHKPTLKRKRKDEDDKLEEYSSDE